MPGIILGSTDKLVNKRDFKKKCVPSSACRWKKSIEIGDRMKRREIQKGREGGKERKERQSVISANNKNKAVEGDGKYRMILNF